MTLGQGLVIFFLISMAPITFAVLAVKKLKGKRR